MRGLPSRPADHTDSRSSSQRTRYRLPQGSSVETLLDRRSSRMSSLTVGHPVECSLFHASAAARMVSARSAARLASSLTPPAPMAQRMPPTRSAIVQAPIRSSSEVIPLICTRPCRTERG